ncbi:MAG: hypothetical protein Q7R39_01770, partial [Dehalococcoidia bacterium]|nr:hypothetical protein [Dehalococcoidia bacterium]
PAGGFREDFLCTCLPVVTKRLTGGCEPHLNLLPAKDREQGNSLSRWERVRVRAEAEGKFHKC